MCYESPKQEKVSHTFEHWIQNPTSIQRSKDINRVETVSQIMW